MIPIRAVSQCQKYQYYRLVNLGGVSNPLGIVGLNPSIIKDGKNPTVSILSKLAVREGFDSLIITNLYGYITPHPKDLNKIKDPVGKENDTWIGKMTKECSKILCIWGNNADKKRVQEILPSINKKSYTIGLTKSGQPRHVLHTKKDSELKKYM